MGSENSKLENSTVQDDNVFVVVDEDSNIEEVIKEDIEKVEQVAEKVEEVSKFVEQKTQNAEIREISGDVEHVSQDVVNVAKDILGFENEEKNVGAKVVTQEVQVVREVVEDVVEGKSFKDIEHEVVEDEEKIVNCLVEEEEKILARDLTDLELLFLDIEQFFADLAKSVSRLFNCKGAHDTE